MCDEDVCVCVERGCVRPSWAVFSSKETQKRQRKGQEQTVDTHNKLLLDSRKPNYRS